MSIFNLENKMNILKSNNYEPISFTCIVLTVSNKPDRKEKGKLMITCQQGTKCLGYLTCK